MASVSKLYLTADEEREYRNQRRGIPMTDPTPATYPNDEHGCMTCHGHFACRSAGCACKCHESAAPPPSVEAAIERMTLVLGHDVACMQRQIGIVNGGRCDCTVRAHAEAIARAAQGAERGTHDL